MVHKKVFVGVAGFEPAASCSQSRRDNRATLHPENIFIRTLTFFATFPIASGPDNRATLHPENIFIRTLTFFTTFPIASGPDNRATLHPEKKNNNLRTLRPSRLHRDAIIELRFTP